MRRPVSACKFSPQVGDPGTPCLQVDCLTLATLIDRRILISHYHRSMSQNSESRFRLYHIVIAAIAIACVLGIYAAAVVHFVGKSPTNAGEFGDLFGGANALFSGMAFVGLIWAILLQNQELHLQRKDLKLTQEELRGQKEQLKAQNITFRRQTFDNAFFQMLSLHNQIVNSIDLVEGQSTPVTETFTGRDCFPRFYWRFKRTLAQRKPIDHLTIEEVSDGYSLFLPTIQADIGHYFRYLYNLIKFVDQSEIDDKQRYINLIRAQLSSHELLMLFYNCAVGGGQKRFKPLVEKYAFLENIPETELIAGWHKGWFMTYAFEERPEQVPDEQETLSATNI